MSRIVVGNYVNEAAATQQVRDLMQDGYPSDSISVIGNHLYLPEMENLGVAVENGADESLWDRIKNFFGFGTGDAYETNLTSYRNDITAGNVLVVVDTDRLPVRYFSQLSERYDGAYHSASDAVWSTAPFVDTHSADAFVADETEWKTADQAKMDTAARNDTWTQEDDATIRLKEERMDVEKESVRAGEAVLHKRVVEEMKTVEVPVLHEEVVIERRQVADRAAEGATFEDETITIPVMEEEVIVSKRPVVTEEVVVHKRDVEGKREVSANLRKESLEVEPDGVEVVTETRS